MGYPQIQEVAPHPKGGPTLFVVREPLLTAERSEFLSHLYLAPDDPGAAPHQLTFGEHRNYAPRWAPDGRTIAFLSTRDGPPSGTPNVYAMRADGGESWALTASRPHAGCAGAGVGPGRATPGPSAPRLPSRRRTRAQRSRDDARVWGTSARFAHLHLIPFRVAPRILPALRRLTGGPMQVLGFDWLPDSRGSPSVIAPCRSGSTGRRRAWRRWRLTLGRAPGLSEVRGPVQTAPGTTRRSR